MCALHFAPVTCHGILLHLHLISVPSITLRAVPVCSGLLKYSTSSKYENLLKKKSRTSPKVFNQPENPREGEIENKNRPSYHRRYLGKSTGRLTTEIVEPSWEFGYNPVPLAGQIRTNIQVAFQRFAHQAKQFFTPRIVFGLGISAMATIGIGIIEAKQMLQDTPTFLEIIRTPPLLQFCVSYSLEQLPSSFAMITTSAETIARAQDLNPEQLLVDVTQPDCAAQALMVRRCENARVALVQLVTVTQLFRLANITMRARDELKKSILIGAHPPKARGERVIRICGEVSDTTPLALER